MEDILENIILHTKHWYTFYWNSSWSRSPQQLKEYCKSHCTCDTWRIIIGVYLFTSTWDYVFPIKQVLETCTGSSADEDTHFLFDIYFENKKLPTSSHKKFVLGLDCMTTLVHQYHKNIVFILFIGMDLIRHLIYKSNKWFSVILRIYH